MAPFLSHVSFHAVLPFSLRAAVGVLWLSAAGLVISPNRAVSPPTFFNAEASGPPRFLGSPSRRHAPLSDPGSPSCSHHVEHDWYCLPPTGRRRHYHENDFEALSRGLPARCLRFAAWVTPGLAQDSLLACWLGFDQVGLAPTGLHILSNFKEASVTSYPIEPGLPWRTPFPFPNRRISNEHL
jgi:hypothetical protein